MLSKKLKTIFLFSILLFYVHGLEEILTDFYSTDVFVGYIANFFNSMPQAVYWILHIGWWVLLLVVFLLIIGGKWHLRIMVLYGIVLIFESHHLIKAIETWGYYPGMITALFFPIVAFFFWRELIKIYKRHL